MKKTFFEILLYPFLPSNVIANKLTYRRVKYALLMLFPTTVVIFFVALYPIYLTILTSLTDAEFITIPGLFWVGLDNYKDVLTDPAWWQSFRNTLLFANCATVVQMVFGLLIAILIDFRSRLERPLKIIVMLPWAILAVVSIQIWLNLFNTSHGFVNALLEYFNLISGDLNWFEFRSTSFFVLVMTDTWKALPFVTILLLAALQTIPTDHWEAARINGTGVFRYVFSIVLPQIQSLFFIITMFRWLDGMRVFEIIFLMTTGSQSTSSLSVYTRERLLEFSEAGAGSAAAILISLFLIATIIVIVAINRIYQWRSKNV